MCRAALTRTDRRGIAAGAFWALLYYQYHNVYLRNLVHDFARRNYDVYLTQKRHFQNVGYLLIDSTRESVSIFLIGQKSIWGCTKGRNRPLKERCIRITQFPNKWRNCCYCWGRTWLFYWDFWRIYGWWITGLHARSI